MVTTAPGLESVAVSEIAAKLNGAWVHETFRGRILFGAQGTLADLLSLRSVDNVYAHVAWFEMGATRRDLASLRRVVASLDVAPALSHLELGLQHPRVTVSASRAGKHSYSRFEAAEAVLDGLVHGHGFRRGEPHDHDVAFRLDIIGADALLSVKLTPPEFRFRGDERLFARAALRPTVAHALVWLSAPRDDQRFLDPFCGSGTIAVERAHYGARRIVASDVADEAVAVARANAGRLGAAERVEVRQWDARRLGLEDESIDVIVTNPPWGTQIAVGGELEALYREFLREARRILAPRGRVILITDQAEALQRACRKLGFACRPALTVSLHGLVPAVYEIQ